MNITLNGKTVTLSDGQTIAELVKQKGLNHDSIIIEHNGELVQKDKWPETVLKEADNLEILRFVGGG